MHGITEVNIIIFFFISALSLLEELISPIITPLVLLFMIRPRAQTIVDFFRNFTVDVTGVGDICSFAQMDVRRHGNSAWQQASPEDELEPQPSTLKAMTNAYTRAEAGKTEMSLINFTLANPDWKPPQESKEFINALRGHATRDVETLSVLDEEKLQSNPLYSSLTALENVGGVYTEIAQNLLKSTTLTAGPGVQAPQVNVFGASAAVSNPFQSQISHYSTSGSMVQSIRQGIANATSFMPPPPNLKKDLRRLGLEYTVADMSLSALYLHELHHRSSQNGPGGQGHLNNSTAAVPVPVVDYQLNDVSEEESIPLVQNV